MDEEVKDTEVQTTEEVTPKSGREVVVERLRTRYPDESFDEIDDDNLYSRLDGMIGEIDGELSNLKENNQKTYGFLMENPKLGAFLSDIRDGEHPIVALNRYFDEGELAIKEGDEMYNAWKAAGDERRRRQEENERLREEIKANMEISQRNIEEFARENGIPEEEVVDFLKGYQADMEDVAKGLTSKDYLGRMYRGYRHNQDVQDALEAGRIQGANEKIEKELERMEADGLPEPNGSGGSAPVEKEVKEIKDPTYKALKNLEDYRSSNSKWEQSGYKRVGKN